jgi:hypothetical protein
MSNLSPEQQAVRLASPLLSPNRAAARIGIGRTKMMALLRQKRIPSGILDGRIQVLEYDCDAFKAGLQPYEPDALPLVVASPPIAPEPQPVRKAKRSRQAPAEA